MNTVTALNPFPGLRPFREDEQHLFFGRESQVNAMVDKLAATRFLAVVGTSGSGKSSLVNCGLRPALHSGLMARAGTSWRMAQFRPGNDPVRAMARALAVDGVLFNDYPPAALTLTEIVETTLHMSKIGLVDIYEQANLEKDINLLVVVDQFEELFRYRQLESGTHDSKHAVSEAAAAFTNLLLEAKDQTKYPIYIVLTMRSDFLGDCTQLPGLAEAINAGQYLVPRMSRDERRQAIAGPVAVGGAEISPVLLTRLVNDVGDNPDQLSILQHALNRTWARWQYEGGGTGLLDLTHYEAIGTMASALDQHAEKAFAELETTRQQLICERLFKALTDKATDARGIRRPTSIGTLCALADATAEEVAGVIGVFRKSSRSFLMPPAGEPLEMETIVDISHESLMRVWERLKRWGDEEAQSVQMYRRLADAAARHAVGEGSLWRNPDLQMALDWKATRQPNETWASRYTHGFNDVAAFLQESEAAQAADIERERARERTEAERAAMDRELEQARVVAEMQRQRADDQAAARARQARLMWGLAVVASVAAGLAAFGWYQSRVAQEQRDLANDKATIAKQQQDIATDQRALAEERGRDAVTEARAAGVARGQAEAQAEAAAIARAQAHARQLSLSSRVESDRDPELAVALAREALVERDADDNDGQLMSALRSSIARHVPTVESNFEVMRSRNYIPRSAKGRWIDFSLSPANVSPRGDVVVPSRRVAVLWQVTGEIARLGHSDSTDVVVGTASFSPEARLIVTAAGNEVRLWNASSGKPLGKAIEHKELINGVVFNRDGTRLITLSDDTFANVEAVNTDGTTNQCTLNGSAEFTSASFSRDERQVVTIEHSNFTWQPRVWSLLNCSAQALLEPDGIESLAGIKDVKWASFSPYGAWLGVVTVHGTAHILNTSLAGWPIARTVTLDVRYEFNKEIARTLDYPVPLAWSSDGRYLAIAGGDHVVYVAPIEGDADPVQLRGHTGRIRSITFHPKDNLLLTTSADKTARLWKLAPAKHVLEVLTLKGHRDAVGSGAFLPGGGVITAGDDGHVRRWTPPWSLTQTERKTTEADARSLSNAEVSPSLAALIADQSNDCAELVATPAYSPLAYCPERNVVWIGRAGRAALVEVLIADDARVESAHFSRSGTILALTFDDYSIRLFDARTGRPRAAMRGHAAGVRQVGFTDDERYMASVARDQTARVWDVARGVEIASVRLVDAPVANAISFSRDGGSVFLDTRNLRTTWRCYACGDRQLLFGEIGRRKIRALTPDERTRFLVDAGPPVPGANGATHTPKAPQEPRKVRLMGRQSRGLSMVEVEESAQAVAAIGFALSTRRDLLLEILALRHQLRVLVRSNRRFRPSDRLLWLVLRRSWPRWRDALVQSSRPPSTVGIAMGSIDVGAAARDVLVDHASIQSVEP